MTEEKVTEGVPYVWFKGLTEQKDKDRLASNLKGTKTTFRLLLSIIKDKYDLVERKGLKEEDYNHEGWDRAQAFRNGKLSAYLEIAELFPFLSDMQQTPKTKRK